MTLEEATAAMFTAPANAHSTVMLPVASAETALPKRFPWLATSSSASFDKRRSLEDEFAQFAEEAQAWADLTMSAGLEIWPDWPDQ